MCIKYGFGWSMVGAVLALNAAPGAAADTQQYPVRPVRVVAPIIVKGLSGMLIVRALIPSPRTMSMRKSSMAG